MFRTVLRPTVVVALLSSGALLTASPVSASSWLPDHKLPFTPTHTTTWVQAGARAALQQVPGDCVTGGMFLSSAGKYHIFGTTHDQKEDKAYSLDLNYTLPEDVQTLAPMTAKFENTVLSTKVAVITKAGALKILGINSTIGTDGVITTKLQYNRQVATGLQNSAAMAASGDFLHIVNGGMLWRASVKPNLTGLDALDKSNKAAVPMRTLSTVGVITVGGVDYDQLRGINTSGRFDEVRVARTGPLKSGTVILGTGFGGYTHVTSGICAKGAGEVVNPAVVSSSGALDLWFDPNSMQILNKNITKLGQLQSLNLGAGRYFG